jgi:hypothetical protein
MDTRHIAARAPRRLTCRGIALLELATAFVGVVGEKDGVLRQVRRPRGEGEIKRGKVVFDKDETQKVVWI